jgi:outer membrane protein assembly factor BamE (lipoprotein component of BamABCDE complex)
MKLAKWILPVALLLASCSSTKARISDNQALYDGYSPEVQAMIKSNRIDRGFDQTQVYLSLGNADRTEARDGQEIWFYHRTHTSHVKEEKSAGEYRDEMNAYHAALRAGRNVSEPSTHRVVRLLRTRVERLVRFESGSVVSWEEPEEMWIDEWHR